VRGQKITHAGEETLAPARRDDGSGGLNENYLLAGEGKWIAHVGSLFTPNAAGGNAMINSGMMECPHCHGRKRLAVIEHDDERGTVLTRPKCGHCEGTGRVPVGPRHDGGDTFDCA
jgi:hypothetical protein